MENLKLFQINLKKLGTIGLKTPLIGAFLDNFGGDIEFQLISLTLKELLLIM